MKKVSAIFALGFAPTLAIAADMPNVVAYRPQQVAWSWTGL
jgi:hypothetical protein